MVLEVRLGESGRRRYFCIGNGEAFELELEPLPLVPFGARLSFRIEDKILIVADHSNIAIKVDRVDSSFAFFISSYLHLLISSSPVHTSSLS